MGYGDFIPLVEYLKNGHGTQVEVIAFGKSCSARLKEVANDFIERRLSGLTQTVGYFIGIDHRHATCGEKRGDRGFAAANASGKTDSQHAVEVRR